MIKTTFLIVFLLCLTSIQAQSNNDILIGIHIPKTMGDTKDSIPGGAVRLLENRLYQIITANGVSGNLFSPRFFLLPRIVILEKEVLSTIPSTVFLHLELTLIVADSKEENGNVFQTTIIELKGVGRTLQKAYINAFRNLDPYNQRLVGFMDDVKSEIIKYYEENCVGIAKKARSLNARRKTKDAVRVIANIPISSSCYEKNERTIKKLYQDFLKQECDFHLNRARAAWYTDQTEKGAKKAGKILIEIAPRAYCKDEMLSLYDSISKRIREIQGKSWDFNMKIIGINKDSISEIKKQAIKALQKNPKRK